MSVRLGVTLPVFTGDAGVFADGIARAEAAGLDSVWVFDHMWPLTGGKERPVLECWTALAWAAGSSDALGVGTLVTRSTVRDPYLVARMADTVSSFAPGRVTIAIGSGDELSRDENEAFGLPYLAGADRTDQLTRFIETVAATLTGGELPRTASARPPIWVAGRSDEVMGIAARVEGWNGWAISPDEFEAHVARIRVLSGGRDVTCTWAGLAVLGEDDDDARRRLGRRNPDRYLWGGPERVAARLSRYVAAGARELILVFPDAREPGPYERLGREVRDALEGG